MAFVFADFVNRADVLVIQRRRSFGFSLEPTESLCIVGEFIRKELQGNVAAEFVSRHVACRRCGFNH